MKYMVPKYIKLFTILLKICNLLQYFQDTFNFVHNDFHHENILIKKDKETPNPYIIDFGFASIETNINGHIYYLTNKANQIAFSKVSDIGNQYNISKSTDIMNLILRLIINCSTYNDLFLYNIFITKFCNYNHTLYNRNLIEDIKKSNNINLVDIYTYSTDYYALFNNICSLPQ